MLVETKECLRRVAARLLSLLGAGVLLASCGGGGDSAGDTGTAPPPAAPGFELRMDSTSVPARQDSSGLLRVHVERQAGFDGAIELKLADPPAGVGGSAVVVEPYQNEAQLPLRIGADVPLGALSLVIGGGSGAATATTNLQLDVQAAQPNSRQLIGAALDAGEIDLGTSLLYRAYAAFGDSRLPEALVGSGPAEEDTALFTDIEDARPNLPQSILDQLQPYLVRPDDPASVFNEGSRHRGASGRRANATLPFLRPAAAAATRASGSRAAARSIRCARGRFASACSRSTRPHRATCPR